MMASILDGKTLATEIKRQIFQAAVSLSRRPGLAVMLVGDDPASQIYVRNKERDCEECGFLSFEHRFPADVEQDVLIRQIQTLNADKQVDGILLQLPVPRHLNTMTLLQAIAPEKDVDCFHPVNVGLMNLGMASFVPCTPAGVLELLKYHHIALTGKRGVMIGRSNIVGKPLMTLLTQEDMTVTLCHSKTQNLPELTQQADIIISAVGKPKLITADMIREGAVVIDVAMNRDESGRLCGDVDFPAVSQKAAWITPVPGGVGPMTRAMLMRNLLTAAQQRLALYSTGA